MIYGLVVVLVVVALAAWLGYSRGRTVLLMQHAQRLIALGQYREALPLLTRIIERYPRTTLAYVLRSQAHRQLGFVEQALEDAEKAVRLEPTDHYGHLVCARLYDHLGQPRDAVEALNAALDNNPTWLAGYLELALHYLTLADPEEALNALGKLTAYAGPGEPLLYDTLVVAGRVFEETLQDVDTAIQAYSRAITFAPERKVGYLVRAWAFRARGDYVRAAEDLLDAAKRTGQLEDQELYPLPRASKDRGNKDMADNYYDEEGSGAADERTNRLQTLFMLSQILVAELNNPGEPKFHLN